MTAPPARTEGSGRKRILVVNAADPQDPLRYLIERLGLPQARARRALAEGAVFVDRRRLVDVGARLRPGARVTVYLPDDGEQATPAAGEAPAPPRVVLADEAFLVVEKPAGLLSQPGPTGGASVSEWLARHHPAGRGAHLLHRLDREVSGLLLFTPAGADAARGRLQRALTGGDVHRGYWAWVQGIPPVSGEIDLRIATDHKDPRKRRALPPQAPGGQEARTRYRSVGPVPGQDALTQVELTLVSGRTHQVRVHLAALCHPILGDTMYGGRPADRVYLHGACLGFAHPLTGQPVRVESAPPF